MSAQAQREKEARLKEAMANLIPNASFTVFIEALREMREGAVGYMIDHATVKDPRESLAAVGEVRCYDTILAAYLSHKHGMEQQAEQERATD